MIKKEWTWMYFNEEWNTKSPSDDELGEDHEDGIDAIPPNRKSSSNEIDDYEEYGN